MTWKILAAVIVLLACTVYLLARFEIIRTRDGIAGAGLVAALVLLWRLLTRRPDPPPEDPAPSPTDDVQRTIDHYRRELDAPPPEDVHDQLKKKLGRR